MGLAAKCFQLWSIAFFPYLVPDVDDEDITLSVDVLNALTLDVDFDLFCEDVCIAHSGPLLHWRGMWFPQI